MCCLFIQFAFQLFILKTSIQYVARLNNCGSQFMYILKGFYCLGNGHWWFIRLWHKLGDLSGLVSQVTHQASWAVAQLGSSFLYVMSSLHLEQFFKVVIKVISFKGPVDEVASSGSSCQAMCSWMTHKLEHFTIFYSGMISKVTLVFRTASNMVTFFAESAIFPEVFMANLMSPIMYMV